MEQQRIQTQFFLLFFLLVGTLTFFIFEPYIYTLFLAITFAVIFSPIHKKIKKFSGNIDGIAAFLTTVLIFCTVLVPITFVAFQIFQESRQIYVYLTNNASSGTDFFHSAISVAQERVTAVFPQAELNIAEFVRQVAQWLAQHLGALFSQLFEVIINFFIFLLALYYLLKDGEKFKKEIVRLSPLDNTYDQHIFDKLTQSINSVIGGSMIIATIQGTMTGVGFYLFGVPNAVLWGTVAAVAALIPSVGTGLVVTPAIIYLFFTGSLPMAIGLLIWGMIAVGLIDNMLGPKIIGKGAQIHSFIILLAVLGGIKFFGLVGFILGPFVITLLIALTNIYSSLMHRKQIQ